MTAAKIAITLPPEQLERVRRAVSEGRASSVSAYISQALDQQDREESLADVLRDMTQKHGEPTSEDRAWAQDVLARRARG
jgi:Arc/MetJ-type ribon-helix-helix transcriptional regulator